MNVLNTCLALILFGCSPKSSESGKLSPGPEPLVGLAQAEPSEPIEMQIAPAVPAATPSSPKPQHVDSELFHRLFDRSLNDEKFFAAVALFEKSLPKVERTNRWHSGQTDYVRMWQGPYERLRSTTYYNSSNAVLHVEQLLYKGRVVSYSYQGGDNHMEVGRGLVADPDGSGVATLAGPFTAWYDYENSEGVAFRVNFPTVGNTVGKRSWFVITKKNEPHVFTERH